ncbi:MAG: hypothetical protein QE487_02360 [Fluviicola sp.]|nr:hypothetical protein [Fluviicola sp.]
MTAKENALIEKAKRVLDEIGINYEGHTIEVAYEMNDLLTEVYPELVDEYSVLFSTELKRGRHNLISVTVDRKTHKLKMVITKYNMYEVPEELS